MLNWEDWNTIHHFQLEESNNHQQGHKPTCAKLASKNISWSTTCSSKTMTANMIGQNWIIKCEHTWLATYRSSTTGVHISNHKHSFNYWILKQMVDVLATTRSQMILCIRWAKNRWICECFLLNCVNEGDLRKLNYWHIASKQHGIVNFRQIVVNFMWYVMQYFFCLQAEVNASVIFHDNNKCITAS